MAAFSLNISHGHAALVLGACLLGGCSTAPSINYKRFSGASDPDWEGLQKFNLTKTLILVELAK
ncbi:MAG: hypothetical protein ABI040_03900, partial [Rhodoferax sp.]